MNDLFAIPNIPSITSSEQINLKKCSIRKLSELFHDNRDSREIFDEIFRRIFLGVKKYISAFCKNQNDFIDQDEIDEVTSMTFTQAWEKRDMFDNKKGCITTWIYNIAKNFELTRIHERDHSPVIRWDINDVYQSTLLNDETYSAHYDNNSEHFIIDNDGEIVTCSNKEIISRFYDVSIAAIEKLPENYRSIVYCKLVNSKKIQDIAEEYHLNVSTVKNWLYKGKRELCKYIKTHHKELYDMYIDAMAETHG